MKYNIRTMGDYEACKLVYLGMPTSQIVEEFAYALGAMRLHVGSEVGTILEIGSAYGGSLILLSQLAADDALIISVDPRPILDMNKIGKFVRHTINIVHICGKSEDRETIEEVRRLTYNSGIDILFIDAVKDAPAPRDNFSVYAKLVNSPGIVMFHEIERPGVADIWSEVSIDYPHEAIHTRLNRLKSWYGLGIVYL